MSREKLFSVTKKDCIFKYYKGSGKGGQKRNKTENCCQCTHKDSGAQAYSEGGRSKDHNTQMAFKKMTETPEFKKWIKIETARATGELAKIKEKVEKEIKSNTKIEVKENGKWKEV